ncbi:hypothetical protein [Tenacibaculum xiamenense]|uniref:hypothetical protein n=1 Tax=Tenacibaculum xiamenense TaxID=1261553 RepID=UPI0038944482
MKKEKEEEKIVSMNGELATSEWFGAIIRYLFGFGKKGFSHYYNEKNLRKNTVVGYVFKLIMLVFFIVVAFYFIKE